MLLQEERATATPKRAVGHDGDPVSKQVGLVHKVSSQHDHAPFTVFADKVPRESAAGPLWDTVGHKIWNIMVRNGREKHWTGIIDLSGSKKVVCTLLNSANVNFRLKV